MPLKPFSRADPIAHSGPGGLRHEGREHERHRQRHDADEDALDAAVEHEVADQRREGRSDQDGEQQRCQREAVGGADVDREHPVGVAREAEEGGLAEAESTAIAPNDAEPHGHEGPHQEVGRIADGPAVDEERVGGGRGDHGDNQPPEYWTTAHGLGSFEPGDPNGEAGAPGRRRGVGQGLARAGSRLHRRSVPIQPDSPPGRMRITTMTAMSSPIWPKS